MLNTPNTAKIESINGKDTVYFDVNFDKKHKEYVKIRLGKEMIKVNIQHMFSFLLMMANPEQMDALTPATEKTLQVKSLTRQHKVKLMKDMKAGEEVVVTCTVDIPLLVEEGIREEFLKNNLVISKDTGETISVLPEK